MYCSNCGYELSEGQNYCPHCNSVQEIQPIKKRPMKWYYFVIWVQLFLNIILAFFNGILMVTGMIYIQSGMMPTEVYRYYGFGLQAIDIFFGLIYLALIPFIIVVRHKLAHYKKNAPAFLLCFYGINLSVNFIYLLAILMFVGINGFNASSIGSFAGTISLIVLSNIYFKKRKDMFCN